MWKKPNQTISAGGDSTNIIAGGDVNFFLEGNVPAELVDQRIEELVDRFRKSRFFSEFDHISASLKLGTQLVDGDLSVGSDKARSLGLAWCARLLSRSDHLDKAEEWLKIAKNLGDSVRINIAEAFIFSQKGDKTSALQILAGVDSPASRSAALMIVANHDGAEGALQWMADAGYIVECLDSDGKSFLLSHQLQLGFWSDAAQSADTLTEADFEITPLLHHLSAVTALISTVPLEFRGVVLTQVPFEAHGFPLASDTASMKARHAARDSFLKAVEFCSSR